MSDMRGEPGQGQGRGRDPRAAGAARGGL